MQKTSKTRILVECALMIALAVVLDILPLPKWPNGGSVSVSMVPIVFLSYRHGTKWGLLTGFTYCIVQMITGFYAPPAGTVLAFALCILLDYVIAFTILGGWIHGWCTGRYIYPFCMQLFVRYPDLGFFRTGRSARMAVLFNL